jgi:hypothetical protein
MLITSRSAQEYRAMFDLSEADLAGLSVLDCCAGGSCFTADTPTARVIAVDPAYALPRSELEASVRDSLPGTDTFIDEYADGFVWDWYGSVERRAKMRTDAAALFLADLRTRPQHYVAGGLPRLPFAPGSFDLVMCSHLLFTWANQLDHNWHSAALADLVRVARREVRVFPLVLQGAGEPVPFLGELIAELTDAGHECELRPTTYRFQRTARELLVIRPLLAACGRPRGWP